VNSYLQPEGGESGFPPKALKSELQHYPFLLAPGVAILPQSLGLCLFTWYQEDSGSMDSILVLPLTVKSHSYVWLPQEVDGAIGPGGQCGGRHLQDVIHAVHTHKDTSHPPLHRRCGDPMEGAAAL
jgi:hypothetical protein